MPYRYVFFAAVIVVPLLALFFVFVQLTFEPVAISLDVEWEEDILVISGETDLVNHAVLTYTVRPMAESAAAEGDIYATGIAVVDRGKYVAEMDTTFWPRGQVVVIVRFVVTSEGVMQPPEVIARYGKDGQRLKGKYVVREEQHNRVEIRKTLSVDLQKK